MSLGEAGLQGWRWPSCIYMQSIEKAQCNAWIFSEVIWGKSYLDDLFGSEDMAAAASFPNVFCKLSGLVTEVPFNCPQWWILILHFLFPTPTPTPGWPTPTPSSFHTLIHPHWHTHYCTRLTRRGKKKFGVQKLSDLTQTSAFHSSAQTGSRWCRNWIERTHDVNEC